MIGPGSWRRWARRVSAASVLLGLAAVGLSLVLGSGSRRPPPPAGCAAQSAAAKVTSRAGRPHGILFIGASYTAGIGATGRDDGYAYLVARALRWPATVLGVPGTGFINAGPHHEGNFAQRMAEVPRSLNPRFVLLQGGRNDVGYRPAFLRLAAAETVCAARARFTGAQIVILGPIPGLLPVDPRLLRVDAVLREVAVAEHTRFIDPLGQHWMTRYNLRGFDGPIPDHPNDAGYAFIARHITAAIEPR